MVTNWLEQTQFLRAENEYLNEPNPDDRYGVRRMNRREEARRDGRSVDYGLDSLEEIRQP